MKNQAIDVCRSVLALSFLSVFPVSAQTLDPETKKETVVLSPFVVTSEGDVGYLAQSSLSGSRLKTNLGDMAVPTTAFTPEFIEDVATTNVDELSKFMLSTETDFPEANQAFFNDDSARVRIRGLPATNYAINYFPTIQRLDHFAAERVDQSRGPNSILFGLGSPGGLINVSSKRANTTRSNGSLTLLTRDTGGLRTMIDYNQQLVKDRAALRIAAVNDDRHTWRENEYDDQERLYLTGALQVAAGTRLDVEWEYGKVNKSLVAPWVIADAYTPWVAAGRRLSATANAAAGVRSLGATNYLVVDVANGQTMNWRNKTTTTLNQVEGVQVYLSDFSIVPKEAAIHANRSLPQLTDSNRLAAFLTHSFTPNLSFELAGSAHTMDRSAFNATSFAVLNADTNATLPTGAVNPNAGRAYLEGFPIRTTSVDEVKALRFTTAYKLDLGIFGNHQFAGLLERDWTRQAILQERLYTLENPYSTAAPDNGNNLIRHRTYVDLDGPASAINVGAWDRWALDSLVESGPNRTLDAQWVNYAAGSADNHFRIDSAMAVVQSRFFDNRLITVAGYRKDWQSAWYSPVGVRAPGSNGFTTGAYVVVPYGEPISETDANNVTVSGLFKVLPWLGVAYNRASNSALPSPRAALPTATGRAPMPRGRSEDFGLKFDLGQRVSLNVTYFKTSAERDYQAYQASDTRPDLNFNLIWAALDAAGVRAPGGGSAFDQQKLVNGYTFDTAAEGVEVELIANPTPNWRVFLNFSDSEVKRTNLGLENRQYFAANREFWMQGDQGRILLDASGGRAPVANDGDAVVETVAEAVAQIEQQIQTDYIVPDGSLPRGQIPRKFNLRTNYSFTEGWLRGWSAGGGARFQSGQVTNVVIAGGNKTTFYGEDTTLVDLNLRYQNQFRLAARSIRWSVQLNVNNVFDETDILPVRVASTGQLLNYRLQVPREFVLTTKFSF